MALFWVVSGRRDLGSGELRSGLWASCVGKETLVTQPLPKDRGHYWECRNLSVGSVLGKYLDKMQLWHC